jgi:hypothetical protein
MLPFSLRKPKESIKTPKIRKFFFDGENVPTVQLTEEEIRM